MKKILFPTDFSETAKNAFIYALKVADKLGASITTLHVYRRPDIRGAHVPNVLMQVYESIDLETFDDYKDSIPALRQIASQAGYGHIVVKHALVEGDTVKKILHYAETQHADMIIMGTKGAGWVKEIFIGSVAGEVLENANCPVLAVPEEATFDGKIDKIAVSIRGAEAEKEVITRMLDWAANFDATVYGVYVDSSHTESINHKMEQFIKEINSGSESNLELVVLDEFEMKEALSKFVKENHIDILAMLTHKRNFFEELFNYSKTKMMSYHTNVPILSIQAHTLKG